MSLPSSTPTESLAALLAHCQSIDTQLQPSASGQVTLQFANISEDQLDRVKALLEELADESVEGMDYSPYFSAVEGSALYKPANPMLAIRQVSKTYDLDPERLGRQYRQSKKR
ncbi:Uncharacterised protein [BD1-7 clade bacterium]|uniref:Uncharacterized protein n=1 Tax=BD1-7 clade bacterium TaxID=2029982 RepID=A0A5S9Q754_9GAMM|nr:Uncharacterised protein [BD1-7 clade bacterium]CAA0113079.1 Uncharacterised protein [BD1-7 clade bacterium]